MKQPKYKLNEIVIVKDGSEMYQGIIIGSEFSSDEWRYIVSNSTEAGTYETSYLSEELLEKIVDNKI